MGVPSRKLLDSNGAEVLGEVQASPTENTVLERLKAVETAVTAVNTLIGAVTASPTENTLLERQKAIETALTAINTLIGEVQASPTENSLLERVKAIETALAALGYEFTINGVNFNGYANIKMLTLDGNAEDDDPITLHDAGVDYQVGVGKVFIAFQALIWLEQIAMVGRIGESDSADGAITKEVIKASNGTQVPFMTDVIGVFAAEKYVTAESDSASDNYTIKSGSVLYGVEVDA